MNVLRYYDPPECDADGAPLDWERCRTCAGRREIPFTEHDTDPSMRGVAVSCPACGGHGSLRAAAISALSRERPETVMPIRHGWLFKVRCEDCGHPMSSGTWEGDTESRTTAEDEAHALWCLRTGVEPDHAPLRRATHWSPCDEGCRHDGPARAWMPEGYSYNAPAWEHHVDADAVARQDVRDNGLGEMEASWRPVDVRTLGWAHDLRPERLAVLCVRCWAARA